MGSKVIGKMSSGRLLIIVHINLFLIFFSFYLILISCSICLMFIPLFLGCWFD